MDFGLQGEGFFAVETPNGTLYTRNGTFRLNENGVLVTQDGNPVLGETGQIQIPAGTTKLTVGSDGQLHTDSATIGKLKLVTFDKPGLLQQAGNSNYAGDAAGPKQAADCSVHQGCLEASNVDPMTRAGPDDVHVPRLPGVRAQSSLHRGLGEQAVRLGAQLRTVN